LEYKKITFNFSRWKADVTTLLRLLQLSPSNEDNPNDRISTKGLRGGFTKCPLLFVKTNRASSASAIMSLGLLPNQHSDIFPTYITLL